MPNYARAIPPEKLASSGNRELYNKIAEFLPFYLNYNKMAPAVTSGDFSNLSAMDALDVVPVGKLGSVATKMAPALGMVITPKTIDKFVNAVKQASNYIEDTKYIRNLEKAPRESRKVLLHAAGVLATRYPRLFRKLSSMQVDPTIEFPTLAHYIPDERSIALNPLLRARAVEAVGHEATHFAQDVYNSPAYKLVAPFEDTAITTRDKYQEYLTQPLEIEAFKRAANFSDIEHLLRNLKANTSTKTKSLLLNQYKNITTNLRNRNATVDQVLDVFYKAVRKAGISSKNLRSPALLNQELLPTKIFYDIYRSLENINDPAELKATMNSFSDLLSKKIKHMQGIK